jgi:DNA-damage-inducible protein J
MSADAIVRARVGGDLRDSAAIILAEMGLSMSDAIRLLLTRLVADRALPFDVRAPNAVTAQALRDMEAGVGVTRYATVSDLMADLNAPD